MAYAHVQAHAVLTLGAYVLLIRQCRMYRKGRLQLSNSVGFLDFKGFTKETLTAIDLSERSIQ